MEKDSVCPKCDAKRRVFAMGNRADLYKCRACGYRSAKHVFWPELKDQRPSLHWTDVAERPTEYGRVLAVEVE